MSRKHRASELLYRADIVQGDIAGSHGYWWVICAAPTKLKTMAVLKLADELDARVFFHHKYEDDAQLLASDHELWVFRVMQADDMDARGLNLLAPTWDTPLRVITAW